VGVAEGEVIESDEDSHQGEMKARISQKQERPYVQRAFRL
jgi:hypothetical protein